MSSDDNVPEAEIEQRFPRRLLIGAGTAAAAMGATAISASQAHAAPASTPWILGGNTNVAMNGSNYIGTRNVAPLIFKTAAVADSPRERMRITPAGTIGVGVQVPQARVHVRAPTGTGLNVAGTSNSVTDVTQVVSATKGTALAATSTDGIAVSATSTTGIGASATSANGVGVQGVSTAATGVLGTSNDVEGVRGTSSTTVGVIGTGPTGVRGEGSYAGVYGTGTYGGIFIGSGSGSYGSYSTGSTIGTFASGSSYGGYFTGPTAVLAAGSTFGVSATATSSGQAVRGSGGQYGVVGVSGSTAGVLGEADYVGVWGQGGSYGVYGYTPSTSNAYAVMGQAANGAWALYSLGNCGVQGTLSKSAGSFRIDHPLDPENKYLQHSFVESPDMMNVYNGNVTLDADGTATVDMPSYFSALNRDYRYQLTTIGAHAPVYVAEEITEGSFRIAGGTAGLKVSWQVTGIRQDDYARAHPIVVELDKSDDERGTRSFLPDGVQGTQFRPRPAGGQPQAAAPPTAMPAAPPMPPMPPEG